MLNNRIMSSPKLLKKSSRLRPFRILILGQPSVGKTALSVRFITRRFIGEYDPTLERKYVFQTDIDGELVMFELLDTAGQTEDCGPSEDNIKWADAYVLVYDITDRCSFDECTRLKFLINIYASRKSRKVSNTAVAQCSDIPVALVGNKNDLEHDRMISVDQCKKKAQELGCTGSYDISVRESIEQVREVFVDLFKVWPKQIKRISRTSPPLPKDKLRSLSEEEKTFINELKTEESLRHNTIKRKESVSRKLIKRVMSSKSIRNRTASDSDKPEADCT